MPHVLEEPDVDGVAAVVVGGVDDQPADHPADQGGGDDEGDDVGRVLPPRQHDDVVVIVATVVVAAVGRFDRLGGIAGRLQQVAVHRSSVPADQEGTVVAPVVGAPLDAGPGAAGSPTVRACAPR